MSKAFDISGYPYIFLYGTVPRYLYGKQLTRADLDVMNPVLRALVYMPESKVFRFELNQLKFRPDPDIRNGEFAGHPYWLDGNGRLITFEYSFKSYGFYTGLKSLNFPEMSNPDFRDRLFMEFAVNGVPTAAEVIPEQV